MNNPEYSLENISALERTRDDTYHGSWILMLKDLKKRLNDTQLRHQIRKNILNDIPLIEGVLRKRYKEVAGELASLSLLDAERNSLMVEKWQIEDVVDVRDLEVIREEIHVERSRITGTLTKNEQAPSQKSDSDENLKIAVMTIVCRDSFCSDWELYIRTLYAATKDKKKTPEQKQEALDEITFIREKILAKKKM